MPAVYIIFLLYPFFRIAGGWIQANHPEYFPLFQDVKVYLACIVGTIFVTATVFTKRKAKLIGGIDKNLSIQSIDPQALQNIPHDYSVVDELVPKQLST